MNKSTRCPVRWDRGCFYLEGNYAVYFGSEQVGKVNVLRQGLYYRFCCRCRLKGEMLCRLRVRCGEKQENLGVLVPVDGGFGLDTRLPVKYLGKGKPEFVLVPKHERTGETFVPVYPEEPFAYLSSLKVAYLARKDGIVGILLRD